MLLDHTDDVIDRCTHKHTDMFIDRQTDGQTELSYCERTKILKMLIQNDNSPNKKKCAYLIYHYQAINILLQISQVEESAFSEFSSFHNMINFPAFCLSVCLSIYEHICVSMRACIYNVISMIEKHKITRV